MIYEAKEEVLQLLTRIDLDTDLVILTNGSDLDGKGKGTSVITFPEYTGIKRHIPKNKLITNFKTELIGLKLAREIVRKKIQKRIRNETIDLQNNKGQLYILSDNQVALRNVANPHKPSSGQYLYLKSQKMLKSIQKLMSVNLWWFPGHSDIEGNEVADKAAKNAAENFLIQYYPVKPSVVKLTQPITSAKKPTKLSEEEQKRVKFKGNSKELL
ncbi:hypothetical protein O181_035836 [Austropuccinia psidii MF-1]|uniref:RNase H type-1 domain-containing protein n=1 Tax=Austropuccinia psidii MF-1 TaxID=1389203 RepID=A0A9Q3H9C1_9BASI|nr:hypothetical protein [Austropuccinia psidii MF-1]